MGTSGQAYQMAKAMTPLQQQVFYLVLAQPGAHQQKGLVEALVQNGAARIEAEEAVKSLVRHRSIVLTAEEGYRANI